MVFECIHIMNSSSLPHIFFSKIIIRKRSILPIKCIDLIVGMIDKQLKRIFRKF